ncbi:FAD-dependent oxidoreductase [Oryzobacter terrae]|uniref:FAD-dependent oxidoreductase n=1 Tax=Oryzobacter terrae TaxID=1620385 RepID=UPI003672D1F9
MTADYLVVGAGPTGMGCATALAARGTTLVLDRIPVTGGTAGWDHPDVLSYTKALKDAGAHLRLGQTALRWDGAALLVTGPGLVDSLPGRHLFIAGGLRPATAANLGVVGERPAGVLPATVAEHLLQARVRLWDHAVIVGDGPWASHVAHACRRLGTKVTALHLLDDATSPPTWGDEVVSVAGSLTVHGTTRVAALEFETPSGRGRLACDAVILAADPRPNRNVEGALLDGASGVTYLQPTQPLSVQGRYAAGLVATKAWLEKNGDK